MSSSTNKQFDILRKTVRELVELNCFNIPDFQRDFTWQSQYNVFLDDVLASYEHKDEDEYYIGTIITYIDPDSGRFEIVDGQQRLTSIFITLMGYLVYLQNENKGMNYQKTAKKVLQKDTWGKNSEEDVPVLTTSDPEAQKWLNEFYNTSFKIPEKNKDLNKWHNDAIKYAVKFFQEADTKRGKRIDIHSLTSYILDNVVIAHVDALNFRQAYIVFERMNDRGKPLSIPDKIKYLLMRKYTVSPEEFKEFSGIISTEWRNVADKFAGDNYFTTFLVHYFTAFYSQSKNKFFAQDELVDWFRENWDDSDDIFELLEHMNTMSDHYINFQDQLDIRKNPVEEPSLAYMTEFFDTSINQHYPILLTATDLSNDKFRQVCEDILKITTVNRICGVKWQTIRTGDFSVMDMVLKLRENDFAGFQEVVKNLIFRTAYKNGIVSELTKKDKFGDKMGEANLRKFLTTKIEDIVTNESGGDFRFTRIETPAVEHKGKKGKAKPKKTTSLVTLEHILASVLAKSREDAKDYENTRETLSQNTPPDFNELEILNIAGRLGNFVASGDIPNTKGNKRPVDEKYKLYKNDLVTTRLIVQPYITVDYTKDPGESDETRTMRKYHFEPIKLQTKDKDGNTYPDKRKYFLLPQIAKREHIIINVLRQWFGFTEDEIITIEDEKTKEKEEVSIKELFRHPDEDLYDCKYCKNPKYNPYKK